MDALLTYKRNIHRQNKEGFLRLRKIHDAGLYRREHTGSITRIYNRLSSSSFYKRSNFRGTMPDYYADITDISFQEYIYRMR